MLNRRQFIAFGTTAAVLTAAVLTVAPANAADAAARAFVTAIYNAYKGAAGNGISLDNAASIRRYFEPALAALIIKDQKEAESRGDAPVLDGDPFVDAQDWEIKSFDMAIEDVAANKASATVKFQNFDKPRTVILDLVKLREGWRIADITWLRDGETSTLRSLFTQQ
jgi:Protein of unknown function (DUF3828)